MIFKRACLVEPHKFDIFEVDEAPAGNQVMLKIASCGLCNWELNFWHGHLNFQGYPHKLGHEFAGTVVALGPDAKKFKVGDKVSAVDRGFGGFAEYRCTDEDKCLKLADSVDLKYAMGEPQKCILTVLRATAPEAGDNGVVLGCGPMGMWCIQAMGGGYLGNLIAVDMDDEKLALAKQFGATHTINSKREDVPARIREITEGRLADFVIEGTGVPALLNAAQHYLKVGRGKLVLMSSHHAPCPEFDFRIAVDKSLQLIAAHPYYSQDEFDDFRRAVHYINSGTFKNREIVSHEFKLSDIQTAFETLANKPANFMKGIVVPD